MNKDMHWTLALLVLVGVGALLIYLRNQQFWTELFKKQCEPGITIPLGFWQWQVAPGTCQGNTSQISGGPPSSGTPPPATQTKQQSQTQQQPVPSSQIVTPIPIPLAM